MPDDLDVKEPDTAHPVFIHRVSCKHAVMYTSAPYCPGPSHLIQHPFSLGVSSKLLCHFFAGFWLPPVLARSSACHKGFQSRHRCNTPHGMYSLPGMRQTGAMLCAANLTVSVWL